MQDSPIETVSVVVRGKVQGVGYRHTTIRRGPPAARVTELESRCDDTERRFKHFAQHRAPNAPLGPT